MLPVATRKRNLYHIAIERSEIISNLRSKYIARAKASTSFDRLRSTSFRFSGHKMKLSAINDVMLRINDVTPTV